MNIRLSILFIACVVVPTSVLALLAGTAMRRWEAVAAARQEREAVHVVRSARAAVDRELRSALAGVRERLATSLAAGRPTDEIRTQASLAERDSPLVERVFIFMNPWGFIHPQENPGARTNSVNPELLALETLLRRETSAGGRLDWIPLQVGDQGYVFGAMGQGGGLHVGFRVRAREAIAAARAVAPPGVDVLVVPLRQSDAGQAQAAEAPGDVIVSDTFGGTIRIADERPGARGAVLAEARLAAPLRDLAVRAVTAAAPEGREAANIRWQLQVLGIALLALAVIAGVGMILRIVWADARRARNQADLVLGVSHDLRTPTASIRALAESLVLGRVADPEKQKRFVSSILREAERLGHLTERTLCLLRFEQGAIAISRGTADVRAVAVEAMNMFLQRHGMPVCEGAAGRATARVGHTDVIVKWDVPEGDALVEGDAAALLQVVSNLLDNAWQYGVAPRLTAWADARSGAKDDAPVPAPAVPEAILELVVAPAQRRFLLGARDGVQLVVRDNGIGLRPAQKRKVFRRFYRTPEARRVHASGVGLGLAFCRHVVAAHRGVVEVESEYGKGCGFTVWLPKAAEPGGRKGGRDEGAEDEDTGGRGR